MTRSVKKIKVAAHTRLPSHSVPDVCRVNLYAQPRASLALAPVPGPAFARVAIFPAADTITRRYYRAARLNRQSSRRRRRPAGQWTLRAAAAAVRRARCRWVVARRSGRSPGEPGRAGTGRAGTDRGRDAAMRLLRGSRRGQSDAARRPTTVISRRFVAPFSRHAPPPPPPPRRLSCAARLGIELMIASPASSSSSRRRGWSALSPATQIPFTAHELNSTLNRTAIRQFQCEQLHRTRPD